MFSIETGIGKSWGPFYQAFHIFNSSPRLPNWVHIFRDILYFLYLFPYVSGFLLIRRDENNFLQDMYNLFYTILYFPDIPRNPKIYLIFSISIVIFITLIIMILFRKSLLLNASFSYFVRFLLEAVLPLLQLNSSAVLQYEIQLAFQKQLIISNLVLIILSTILFEIVYIFHKLMSSHALFSQSVFLASWNLMPITVLTYVFAILFQLRTLIPFYGDIVVYHILGFCSLFCICEVVILINFPFYRKQDQFLMMIFWIICTVQSWTDILCVIWPSLIQDTLIIQVLNVFIAYVISALIINNYYHINFSEKLQQDPNDEIQLENLDNDDIEEDDNEDFAVSSSRIANRNLSYLMITDSIKAVKFARYHAENSNDNDLRINCYRYLTLMHQLSPSDITEIKQFRPKDVSLTKRQLLCDLQYEVFSIQPNEDTLNSYIGHLTKILNQIRRVYFDIIEMISMAQNDDIDSSLFKYNDLCNEFEKYAKYYAIQCPKSIKLCTFISNFYLQIKSDVKLAAAWSISDRTLISGNSSVSDIEFKKERKSLRNSVHNLEFQTTQSLAVQNQIKQIKSIGLRWSIFIFVISMIFTFVVTLTRITPQNFITMTNQISHDVSNSVNILITNPIRSVMNVTRKVVETCDETYVTEFTFFDNLEPFDDYHEHIYDLSNLIYTFNVITVTNEDILTSWASPSKYIPRNLTLHAVHSLLAILLDSFDTFTCTNKSATDINTAQMYFASSTFTLTYMNTELYNKEQKFLKAYRKTYNIFSICCVIAVMVLSTVLGVLLITRKRTERGYFWNSLIEIDPRSIGEVRKRLVRGDSLISEIRGSETSSNEADNILGSDELDNPSGSVSNDREISLDAEYMPVDEYNTKKNKTKIEKLRMYANTRLAFILISLLYFLAWSLLISLYIIPAKQIFALISYAEKIFSALNEVSAGTQFAVVMTMNAFINKSVNRQYQNYDDISQLKDYIDTHLTSLKSFDENTIDKNDADELEVLKTYMKQDVDDIFSNISAFYNSSLTNSTNLVLASKTGFVNLLNITNQYTKLYNKRLKIYATQYFSLNFTNKFIGMIFSILYFIFILYRIILYYREFSMFKNMLLVIPTTSKQAITMAVDLFSKTKRDTTINEMNLSRHIIKQSLNGILMVSSSGIIQDANNSAILLLKRKKEEIIQQNVANIIADINQNSMVQQQFRQLFEMQDDAIMDAAVLPQSKSAVTEAEFTLTTRTGADELKIISCKVLRITNVMMWGDNMSYAFIIRDMSEFYLNENMLKAAQNRVENLLSKIMPKVIATRLMSKSDHEDIISCVVKAVIIFIGINNFIHWCVNKNHEEIMQLLDSIFSKFDHFIVKYPTLVKIKMINGVYMAAAGLFNEVSDRTPVHEAVAFCLECGKWCLERNQMENENEIHLNIGVNYDGPIISGVLGREKPLYDVWGDAVNVSARLETSSFLDTIQMLPSTYHALPAGIYKAIERQDVYLKGKGTTNTFYIPISEEVHIDQQN